MDHPDQSYISYQDHCAFVAEFKRLFEDLKWKYERSRQRMTSRVQDLETTLRATMADRDDLKRKFKKLTIEVQDKERELHTTLECLQDVVEHGRNTERRNLLKMARREKRLKADWMNGWKSHRRKIDRSQRRLHQKRQRLVRQKQASIRVRIKLWRIKARIQSLCLQLDSQQQVNDMLNRKNQRLKTKLKVLRQVFYKNEVFLEHDDHFMPPLEHQP